MIIGIDIRPLMDEYYSGVSEYTVNLLWAIFRQDKKNAYRLFYNSFRDVSDRIPEFNFPNVAVIKLNYPNKFLNYFLFKIFKRPKIDKIIGGADIFWLPNFNFIALSKNCRKIISVHDLSFLRYPHYFSRRHNFWQKNINIKKLLRSADKVIAVSDNTKQDVYDLGRIPLKKIRTIYSGVGDQYRPVDHSEPHLSKVITKYRLPAGKFMLF